MKANEKEQEILDKVFELAFIEQVHLSEIPDKLGYSKEYINGLLKRHGVVLQEF